MNKPQIIIVEDDLSLREGLQEFLQLSGFDVTAVGSGIEFYKVIIQRDFSVAIIDLGLPDIAGQQLVDFLRQKSETAVIVLTASNTLGTRVESYESGADLFLSKPVDTQELVAAIRSLSSRQSSREKSVSRAEPPAPNWTTKPEQWMLIAPNGQAIKFTAKEFEFLLLLINQAGVSVPRDQLLLKLYARQDDSSNASLTTLIKRVRKRIELAGISDNPILTEHGTGYRFAMPVFKA